MCYAYISIRILTCVSSSSYMHIKMYTDSRIVEI